MIECLDKRCRRYPDREVFRVPHQRSGQTGRPSLDLEWSSVLSMPKLGHWKRRCSPAAPAGQGQIPNLDPAGLVHLEVLYPHRWATCRTRPPRPAPPVYAWVQPIVIPSVALSLLTVPADHRGGRRSRGGWCETQLKPLPPIRAVPWQRWSDRSHELELAAALEDGGGTGKDRGGDLVVRGPAVSNPGKYSTPPGCPRSSTRSRQQVEMTGD